MSQILRKIIRLSFIVIFLCQGSLLFAQKVEVGATIGCANYVGDIAPSMVVKETKPAGGIFGRYNFNSSWAFTGSLFVTQISGSDQNFEFNNPRNLSFRCNITEFSGVFEFNYLKYALGVRDQNFTSYIFLGMGMLKYNPQANYEGEWIDLRPIQTEYTAYSKFSVAIPFGIGIKWRLSRHLALESSVGFRKTYTDYLDDVSKTYADAGLKAETMGEMAGVLTDRSSEINNGIPQFNEGYRRGNADFRDWYIIAGVSLSVRIFDRQKCARFY